MYLSSTCLVKTLTGRGPHAVLSWVHKSKSISSRWVFSAAVWLSRPREWETASLQTGLLLG